MEIISNIQFFIHKSHFIPIELVGIITILSFYSGRLISKIKLPSLLGYMIVGALLGPSFLDLINVSLQEKLSFIPEIALSFVALSIGMELNFNSLKRLGKGIVHVIIFESFGAFFFVLIAVYLITKNLPLSIIFACIAPASAPAGTVAVIQEYKAKGNLTKALYAVVGFDDGLGIMIFGLGASIAKNILLIEAGVNNIPMYVLLLNPLKEILFSIILGLILGYIFCLLIKKLKHDTHYFILIFGFILTITGLCDQFHLSYILTNMVFGITLVNKANSLYIHKIERELKSLMPLLFILFFTLAGSNLHIKSLYHLKLIGLAYIVSRSLGLILGSRFGAITGKMDNNIKKYLGLGILSQAGVAIGLSLIVKQEFKSLGKIIDLSTGITVGDNIGIIVITTITATCLIFEIIGPICTKYALEKAGEIKK